MLCNLFLLAVSTTTTTNEIIALSSGQTTVYPLDSGERGTNILHLFNETLSHATGPNYPEFALQTLLPNSSYYATYKFLINGTIPFIQSITSTPNNTLLIIGYQINASTSPLYIALPPEQITALLYFPHLYNEPSSTAAFTSTFSRGVFPFFTVDMSERAVDIISVVSYFLDSTLPYKTSASQVWIQTTLNGPYTPYLNNVNIPGLVQNVLSISLSNSFLQIEFRPNNVTLNQTILVEPEQVQQINMVFNPNYPGSLF